MCFPLLQFCLENFSVEKLSALDMIAAQYLGFSVVSEFAYRLLLLAGTVLKIDTQLIAYEMLSKILL